MSRAARISAGSALDSDLAGFHRARRVLITRPEILLFKNILFLAEPVNNKPLYQSAGVLRGRESCAWRSRPHIFKLPACIHKDVYTFSLPSLFFFSFPHRRRLPPATPNSSPCSWMPSSWWAASPQPFTPCSAPTCCPISSREAGMLRRPPASCWRQATAPRRAPCCWLTVARTGASSPSTLPWP